MADSSLTWAMPRINALGSMHLGPFIILAAQRGPPSYHALILYKLIKITDTHTRVCIYIYIYIYVYKGGVRGVGQLPPLAP